MNPSESDPLGAGGSSAEGSDSALLRALARHLSQDEKKIRDHEIAEQAKKYFGGLDQRERRLLGMDDPSEAVAGEIRRNGGEATGSTAVLLSEDGEAARAPFPGESLPSDDFCAGVWMRALLTAVTFGAMFYWVVFGK